MTVTGVRGSDIAVGEVDPLAHASVMTRLRIAALRADGNEATRMDDVTALLRRGEWVGVQGLVRFRRRTSTQAGPHGSWRRARPARGQVR